jgi:hypothetical protein
VMESIDAGVSPLISRMESKPPTAASRMNLQVR